MARERRGNYRTEATGSVSSEKEIDSGAKYSLVNIPKSSISDTQEVNKVLLGECMVQEDVKMYSQFPDYDDFRRFDFPNGTDLTAISKRIGGVISKPSWLTLKHHLFSMHIPKKLVKSVREIPIRDKKGEFKEARLFRIVAKISISRNPR